MIDRKMDYYQILGVSQDAGPRDIKSAFRKKAKFHHPDTARINRPSASAQHEWGADSSAEAMRQLIEAYDVLADARKRREYDRRCLRIIRQAADTAFDYRIWLKERLNQPEYVAKLVFYDLLHGYEDEALELYAMNSGRDDGRLERFFERPEAMDAEFCIAEELIKRQRFADAWRVLVKLIRMEQQSPGFGYFYDVVLICFRKLVLDDLGRILEPEPFVKVLQDSLALRASAELDANLYRRLAEVFLKLGRLHEAEAALNHAVGLKPGKAGLSSLRSRLEQCRAAACCSP
jgi:tetratricopeptide (TPR) repeat protein